MMRSCFLRLQSPPEIAAETTSVLALLVEGMQVVGRDVAEYENELAVDDWPKLFRLLVSDLNVMPEEMGNDLVAFVSEQRRLFEFL